MTPLDEPKIPESKTARFIARVRGSLATNRQKAFTKQREDTLKHLRPFLRPQEQAQRVVIGYTGVILYLILPAIYLLGLSVVILDLDVFMSRGTLLLLLVLLVALAFFWVKARIIAVTNRSVLVFASSRFKTTRPGALLHILPRQTRLGPAGGYFSPVRVGPETLWVNKQFLGEIEAADSSLRDQCSSEDDLPTRGRWSSAAAFMLLGPLAMALGLSDLSTGLSIQHWLVGGMFALTGLAMIAASVISLKSDWSSGPGPAVSIVAAIGGIVIGFYLAGSQVFNPGHNWLVVLLGIAVVGVSASAIRRIPRSAASQGLRSSARLVTVLGVSGGLLWSAATFWYQQEYTPARSGPALNVTLALKEEGKKDPLRNIRVFLATITIKNAGSAAVQSVSSLYSVVGLEKARANHDDQSFFSQAEMDRHAFRYTTEQRAEVIQFGSILEDGWYFAPGEDYTTNITIEVPEDGQHHYHIVRLSTQVIAANRSLLYLDGSLTYGPELVDTPDPKNSHDLRYVVKEMPIRQLSRIRSLTREEQSLTILQHRQLRNGADVPRGLPRIPFLEVCIDRPGRLAADKELVRRSLDICDYSKRQTYYQENYGLVSTTATHEVPLVLPSPQSEKADAS